MGQPWYIKQYINRVTSEHCAVSGLSKIDSKHSEQNITIHIWWKCAQVCAELIWFYWSLPLIWMIWKKIPSATSAISSAENVKPKRLHGHRFKSNNMPKTRWQSKSWVCKYICGQNRKQRSSKWVRLEDKGRVVVNTTAVGLSVSNQSSVFCCHDSHELSIFKIHACTMHIRSCSQAKYTAQLVPMREHRTENVPLNVTLNFNHTQYLADAVVVAVCVNEKLSLPRALSIA